MVVIKKTCKSCERYYRIKVTKQEMERLSNGEHVQNVLPHVSEDERELLISGICGKCFDDMIVIFGEEM